MIKVSLTNEILKYITEIEKNRYKVSNVKLSPKVANRLRKNSKKKSSYASNKIEGNPLSEKQVDEVIESDGRKHFLKPEQEVRNYFLALNYLEEKVKNKEAFSRQLVLDVQKLVEKGASKEKIGLRGPMPPGVLFAVYDSKTGTPDYIPPEYCDIPALLDELVQYVNTTDDHPLIVAAIVHYQLVTIHPFEDGNGRTARLLSGYILDLNGYGFNGIGSLEEYFAYDIDEYYESIQMGLPALYYSGRENPPHPEIWINYFLRMVLLYSNKVCDLQLSSREDDVAGSISFLKGREKELLLLLIKNYKGEFTPVEISRELSVTNKTVINRLSVLSKNGFVVPVLVKERIRSYKLSEFTKEYEKEIVDIIENNHKL
jgi:Fic family protein